MAHGGESAPRLQPWRENVGAPVALDLAPALAPADDTSADAGAGVLVVLSWNVWAGRGRLREVIERARQGGWATAGASPGAPLVVLVQEASRADSSVPERSNGRTGREPIAGHPRDDVVETAHALGLNLRYAPSMRNGTGRSDRGNAILSTLPLEDARGWELPLVLQRRVALAATLTAGRHRLLVVSAHLDPRGPPGRRWLGAAGRALQAHHLLPALEPDPVVLGADLNLARGRSERAWRLIEEAGFRFGVPPTEPAWRHTFHAFPRLVLDYILIRDRAGAVVGARIHRLDEDPRDRGSTVFGSDHHPLLARLELR